MPGFGDRHERTAHTYRRNVERLHLTFPSPCIRCQTVVTRFCANASTISSLRSSNSTHHTARAAALSIAGKCSRTKAAHSSGLRTRSRPIPAATAAGCNPGPCFAPIPKPWRSAAGYRPLTNAETPPPTRARQTPSVPTVHLRAMRHWRTVSAYPGVLRCAPRSWWVNCVTRSHPERSIGGGSIT